MSRILPGLIAMFATALAAPARGAAPCGEFEELSLALEQNATDGDTEVVLFAKGGDDGLKSLQVAGPSGRKVVKLTGDRRGIGLREFLLESAEPPDLPLVLASFPEGTYSFSGKTVEGECLRGSAALSHQIAPAATLLTPAEDEVVAVDALVLSWSAVAGAERYVVELNNEDTGSEITFEVFPPTASLEIPPSVLEADSEYQYGLGVRAPDGNLTVVERTFFTAP